MSSCLYRCMHTPSVCIQESLICNQQPDCPHGEDESGCNPECFAATKYVCPSNPYMCIDVHQQCDGVNNCKEGEDEQGCTNIDMVKFSPLFLILLLVLVIVNLLVHNRKCRNYCRQLNARRRQLPTRNGEAGGVDPEVELQTLPPSYEDVVSMGIGNPTFQAEVVFPQDPVILPAPPDYNTVAHILPASPGPLATPVAHILPSNPGPLATPVPEDRPQSSSEDQQRALNCQHVQTSTLA